MEPQEPPPPHRKRRKVFNTPGHAHELTFSCHRRLPLLSSDRTRQWLVDAIEAARQEHRFELWAFVIMPEHVHLLLLPREREYDISRILSAIKLPVARKAVDWLRENDPLWVENLRVERPNGRVEYRFWLQGGGYDRNIVNLNTAWSVAKYIHDNPVRRGLAGHATDWRWSSARQYAGMPDVVLTVDTCPL